MSGQGLNPTYQRASHFKLHYWAKPNRLTSDVLMSEDLPVVDTGTWADNPAEKFAKRFQEQWSWLFFVTSFSGFMYCVSCWPLQKKRENNHSSKVLCIFLKALKTDKIKNVHSVFLQLHIFYLLKQVMTCYATSAPESPSTSAPAPMPNDVFDYVPQNG